MGLQSIKTAIVITKITEKSLSKKKNVFPTQNNCKSLETIYFSLKLTLSPVVPFHSNTIPTKNLYLIVSVHMILPTKSTDSNIDAVRMKHVQDVAPIVLLYHGPLLPWKKKQPRLRETTAVKEIDLISTKNQKKKATD